MTTFAALNEVLRNFFRKPMTLMFPKEKLTIADTYRGQHSLDVESCISCGLCAQVCSSMAIDMVPLKSSTGGENEKLYPRVDMTKCCFCRMCADICPKGALVETSQLPEATFDPSTLILEPGASDEAE